MKWISIKERLPEFTERLSMWNSQLGKQEEFGDKCKATVLGYNGELGVFKAEYNRTTGWSEIASRQIRGGVVPTYWMPVPDCPESI